MNIPSVLILALACVWCMGCDRPAADAERLAREREALERDKSQFAADQAAAERAVIADERTRLDAERAALADDKAKLAARANTEREARLGAAEKRAADESAARTAGEARARDAAQNVAEQSVEFFYGALDPHGDWLRVEPYGYCWQPRQARDPRWRPYTDGGWVYTDYGWTWRSNEPFGWAVYHYGRWTRLPRRGWIWIPNTEWGPAWVSWRRSDEHIGWAPLPPDAWSASGFSAAVDAYFDIGPGLYSFVRIIDFGEPTYLGRVVEPEQNVTIVHQTVNVTNVTYKTVKNKVTIVNQGPDIAVINQRSRTPVQRLALEREPASADAARPARIEGSTLRVVAPELRSKGAGAKPRQVKEELQSAEVDRGWTEAKEDAPRIRAAARKHAQDAEAAERAGPRARADRPAEQTTGTPERSGRPDENAGPGEKRGISRDRQKAAEERLNDPPRSPPPTTPAPPPPSSKSPSPPAATPTPAKPSLKPFREPAPASTEPTAPAIPADDAAAAAVRKKQEKREQ